jgi:type IV pilus assembly protein PilA
MIDTLYSRLRQETGFSLMELIVVMLIIGVLSAVAVPSFLAQRSKGQDVCAKTQVRTMMTAMETVYTDTNAYTTELSALTEVEGSIVASGGCGQGTVATVDRSRNVAGTGCTAGGTSQDYCVSQSSPTRAVFVLTKATGQPPVRTCGPVANRGEGGCPESGTW